MASGSPWVMTGEQRAGYEAQFASVGPVGGLVSGEQARGLFMQSGLPPPVLGHIWGLADLNRDGKMDRKEFAIAVHLIHNTLRGIQPPPVLPESLKVPFGHFRESLYTGLGGTGIEG